MENLRSLLTGLTPQQRSVMNDCLTIGDDVVTLEQILKVLPFIGEDGDIDFEKNPEEIFGILTGDKTSKQEFIKKVDMRKLAREASKKPFEHWNNLNKIVERQEELIRKRWLKKWREQRTKILRAAWDRLNMATVHRPEFKRFDREQYNRLKEDLGSANPDVFKWPYINIEDLVKGKVLLPFINWRRRNYSKEFIYMDWEAVQLGWVCGAIKSQICYNNTKMFRGDTPETYKNLLSWGWEGW